MRRFVSEGENIDDFKFKGDFLAQESEGRFKKFLSLKKNSVSG